MPVLDWPFTPSRRPFRWSLIVSMYVIPIVPAVRLIKGLISCLRAHSLEDLRAMTARASSPNYDWQIGEERSAYLPLRITYLGGCPKKLLPAD